MEAPETSEINVTIDNATEMMFLFCGHEEDYNGSDDKGIDYICSRCTQRLCNVSDYVTISKELSARQRAMRRPRVQIKKKLRGGNTIATC